MSPEKAKLSSRLQFHDWEHVLTRSELPSHRKESWAITIRWYLSWAKRARVPIDFDSARDFIAQVELEKRPSPHRLEQWKEAIRWFFKEGGRRQQSEDRSGDPRAERVVRPHPNPLPLERESAVGPTDWRAAAVRVIRVRKYAYRTEQTYLEWLARFEKFLHGRDLVPCGVEEVRAFLDNLAVQGKVTASTQRQALGLVES